MATWDICASCGLKHTPRRDKICPRCKSHVDEPVFQTGMRQSGHSAMATSRAAAKPGYELLAGPARLAGVLMILNGTLLFTGSHMGMFKNGIDGDKFALPFAYLGAFALAPLIAAGIPLAGKVGQALLAIAAVWTPFHYSHDDIFATTLRASWLLALALLLVGEAESFRVATAVGLSAIVLGCMGLAIYGWKTGHYPLAPYLQYAELEAAPRIPVRVEKAKIEIDSPGASWFTRSLESLPENGKGLDLWLTRPDRDAHIIVASLIVPKGAIMPMEKIREIYLKQMEKVSKTKITIAQEQTFPVPKGSSWLLQGNGETDDGKLAFLIALYFQPPHAACVVVIGPSRNFDEYAELAQDVAISLKFDYNPDDDRPDPPPNRVIVPPSRYPAFLDRQ